MAENFELPEYIKKLELPEYIKKLFKQVQNDFKQFQNENGSIIPQISLELMRNPFKDLHFLICDVGENFFLIMLETKIENIEHHPKELIEVDIQSLSVEIKVKNFMGANYYFQVHRLSKEIDVGESYFEVEGGKISFYLMKKEPENWKSLLYHDPKLIAKYEEILKEHIASNPVLKRKEHVMNLWNIETMSMIGTDLACILTALNISDLNSSRKVTPEEIIEYLKLKLSDFSGDDEFSLFAYAIYLQEKTKLEKLDEKYMGKRLKREKKNNPRNTEAENLKNKGNGYFKIKNYFKALECYSQAIKLDPKCASYYSNRSVVHFHMNQFVFCITDALQALAIDPFYSTPWLYLGKSFRYMLIIDTSITCFLRAKHLDTANFSFDKELDVAYILYDNIVMYIKSVKLGNNSEKETCIKHIFKINRKDSGVENWNFEKFKFGKVFDMFNYIHVIGRLIKLLCSQEMISHAKAEARYLIIHESCNVKDTFINYLLGICYYFEDNEKEALANFKKFLKMIRPDSIYMYDYEVSYCNDIEAIYLARRKGNDYFDNCQFDDAIKCYLKEINNLEIIMIVRSNLFYKIACAKLHLHEENLALTYLNLAIDECQNNHEAFAARGEYYLRQKTFKDALDNFDKANKLHPCDRYIELIQMAKLTQSSLLCDHENLQKEKPLQKSLAYCKKEKGNKHFNNNCFDDAISAYTEAISLDPINPVYYSNRAACHIMLKDFVKGLKDCEEALRIDSSFVKGLYRLSKCQIALGRPDEAITALVKALIINPKDRNLLEEKMIAECVKKISIDGDNEYNAKNYETAERYFSEAIEKAEACVELRLKKIDCLIHLEKFDEALAEADLVVPFDRDNSNLYYFLGICHFHKQERDKSIECLKKSLTLKADDNRASNFLLSVENVFRSKELGDKAYGENRFNEALFYYEEGLKQDVINKTLTLVFHLNIGKIQMRENNNIEEAINHFSSIINMQAENCEAYKHRAECYLRLNLLEKAVQDFEELYKFAPNKEHEILVCEAKAKLEAFSKLTSEEELEHALSLCKQERANKYFQNKNYKAALECYTEAIHLNSDNSSLYISRASCFIAMKNYPLALVDAKEAIKKDDNCVQAFIMTGDCHIILGNAKEAISSFEQATKLDKDNTEICAGIQKALKLKQCLDNAENALRNGRIDRAYDMYKCASRTAVGCSSLLLNVAECLISLQRLPALSKLIESVSDMLQESSEYLCMKGLDYYHKDKMSDTIKYLEKAVEVDSSNKKCNEYLHKIRSVYDKKKKGNCAFFQLKYDEALDYYKEGLNIETDNLLIQSKLHFNIGVVLKKQNMLADAISRFTRAISLQDTYINALEKRAECFKKINDLENAIKDYDRLYVITNSKKYITLKEDLKKPLGKKSSKKDLYEILKISRGASMDEIRKAYKALAKEFHPDRLRTEIDKEIGEEKFKEINEAYTVLSDPLKREKYDRGETDDRDIPFGFPFHPFMFNPFARAAFFRFQENVFDPFF